MDPQNPVGVHLFRAAERRAEVSALEAVVGGRVGVEGVLGDLNRTASAAKVPGKAAAWGFRWDEGDDRTRHWYPQGITTSADAGDPDHVNGRSVVCVSWYYKSARGLHKGARVSFVDVTDLHRPRYRHVLLVEPYFNERGQVDVKPVKVHAGGIVWHGPYLHVAGTARGLYSFRLDDIVRVPAGNDRSSLGLTKGGVDSFGYRYFLPVRFKYDAFADQDFEKMRYSFLSIDRSRHPHHLVAGEYGRRGLTTRLVSYEIDPETSLLLTHTDGRSRPLNLPDEGVSGMQGATVVDGTYYVTTSLGKWWKGSLYVGQPGAFKKFRKVLPAGPEDITYWPSRGQLWSLTEYPRRRYVFAMNRSDFG